MGLSTKMIIVKFIDMNSEFIYHATFNNRNLVLWKEYVGQKSPYGRVSDYYKTIGSMKIKGAIQQASMSLIRKRFEAWYRGIKALNNFNAKLNVNLQYRFVLITLTLPATQSHSDEYLKMKALKPFIKNLERHHGVKNWAWKAEAQQNGNIHFHIVVDKFVQKEKLDEYWKMSMKRLGYWQCFMVKHGHENTNSVNVRGQKQMVNPVSYITKYFEKNEDKRQISGAIWRMSERLVRVKLFSFDIDNKLEKLLMHLEDNKDIKVKKEEYFVIYTFKRRVDESLFFTELAEKAEKFYFHLGMYLQGFENHASKISLKSGYTQDDFSNSTRLDISNRENFQQLFIPGFDALPNDRPVFYEL